MAVTSPHSNTRTSIQTSDIVKKEHSNGDQDSDIPIIKAPSDTSESAADNKNGLPAANAPLAPPPKPSQNGDNSDYFSGQHNQSHLSKEPNPFENAFGNPAETPGKTSLPGVTSLTSPASLLPGNTPGWPGSLRSGPLSPAMLTGPTGTSDYFNSDHHFQASFPTPNESSLRTGLTPGGAGSMFPQPSPNSQALYNQLQSGGATPGTLDFHRTAMTARAQNQASAYNNATSAPQQNPNIQPDLDSKPYTSSTSSQQQDNQDPFSSHQTNDAANGLFMLAQGGAQRNAQQQSFQAQQQQHQQQQQAQQQQQQQQTGYQSSVQDMDKRGAKNSIGSTMSGDTEGGDGPHSENGDSSSLVKGRGKKGSISKASTNGKRKNEETPIKSQSTKKARGSNGHAMSPDDMMDDDMQDMDDDMSHLDNRRMTDEEKRKNFLERNRVAALKCRQRKKQWLANLQQKVEIFSTENDALAATVTQLREEIVGLKTLLLAHKDCPVSQAQGISGMAMQQIAGETGHFANPYGMAMGPGGQQQMGQANMQRR